MKWKNKTILVADPDVKMIRRVNATFKNYGARFINVKDGPRALELAVSLRPDLIIMEISLPFLNAIRIAQILKSNPNLKSVPIIFLAAGEINPAYLPFLENAVIQKPVRMEEMIARIDASFMKAAKAIEVSDESREVLGHLDQMPIVDILQIFNMNKKEGVLVLKRENLAEEGMIFLIEGDIVNAVTGAAKGEKALYRLLGWNRGTFEYVPKNFSPEITIDKPTDALLMEGMRQMDEWRRLSDDFPPMDAHLSLKMEPQKIPGRLRPVTKEVLALVEFYKKVADVLDHCSYPDFEVMLTLHTLISKGILASRSGAPRKVPRAMPILTSEEAFAIKEGLKAPYRETYEMDMVRIPIITDNIEALRQVTNLFARIDGFKVAEILYPAEGNGAPLGPVGKVRASENITLLFYALPFDTHFLPLWSPFMADSVGSLLLRREKSSGAVIRRLKEVKGTAAVIVNMNDGPYDDDDEGMLQLNMKDMEKEEPLKVFHAILGAFLELSN